MGPNCCHCATQQGRVNRYLLALGPATQASNNLCDLVDRQGCLRWAWLSPPGMQNLLGPIPFPTDACGRALLSISWNSA